MSIKEILPKEGERFMNTRLEEVDYLRAITCLCVVLIHVTANYLFLDTAGTVTKMGFFFVNRAVVFVVPAFIFISGFILAQRYQNREFAFFPFLKKRLKYILLPYLGWTLFYYLLFVSQNIYDFSLRFFLKSILLGDMVYHLYFVVIIVQFYLLFGVFRWLFQKYSAHVLMAIFLLMNILFMKYVHFQYVDRFFLQYICFFAFGIYFSINYQLISSKICYYRSKLAVAYVLMAIFMAWQFYSIMILKEDYNGFLYNLSWLAFSLLAIVFLYSIAVSLQKSKLTALKNFLYRVSGGSYLIYLSHPLMLMVAQRFLKYEFIPSTTLHFLCTFVFVLGTVLPATFFYQAHNLIKAKG